MVNVPSSSLSSASFQSELINHHHHNHHRHHSSIYHHYENASPVPPQHHQQQQMSPLNNRMSKSLSKSESRLDTWRLWPEYAVEQETDTSVMSNAAEPGGGAFIHSAAANSNNSWVKTAATGADSSRLLGYFNLNMFYLFI